MASRWTAPFAWVRHRPLYALLAAGALAVAAWSLWPRPLAVETVVVGRGPLAIGFSEEGRTRLRERYVVSAPVEGVVERVILEPGDAVRAGEAVAAMHPAAGALLDPVRRAEAEARWRAATAEVAAAQAAVRAAQAEAMRTTAALRRGEALAADRLIARDSLDALRTQARAAGATRDSAGARLRAARAQQAGARALLRLQGAGGGGARLVLTAPVDGRVIRRHVESESPVPAGQPLLEIGDPAALEVLVEVLTADAARLRPGSAVTLAQWGGAAELPGRVRTVEPGGFTKVSALGVEEQRVNVIVDIDAPTARRAALGDGYRVEARFTVWSAEDVLAVPTAALFRDGGHWAVYVAADGRARLRRLRLGALGAEAAQVLDGLRAGERVILHPGDAVRDGLRVAAGAR